MYYYIDKDNKYVAHALVKVGNMLNAIYCTQDPIPPHLAVAAYIDYEVIEHDEVINGRWIDLGLSKEQLVETAIITKQYLIEQVSKYIAPLQDAVDLDMATDEEIARLKVLKTYRVLLNRVNPSLAPDIVWPEKPEGID